MGLKFNIANPETSQQKVLSVEDEHKVMHFYERRMGAEMEGEFLGEEFKGFLLKITGGNDKQGFPMMQGVLRNQRVRLLFSKGMPCYRERRKGMRKRKSVRGCIVGPDLAIINLVIVKQPTGAEPIEGLTDGSAVRRLGPKRASKLRKFFSLDKDDDVKKAVVRRDIMKKDDPEAVRYTKAPKIQRLITKRSLQRKRFRKNSAVKKIQENKELTAAYKTKMHEHRVALKERRHAEVAKKKKKQVKKAGAKA
jgi:small subunit ribosomal protein S6e